MSCDGSGTETPTGAAGRVAEFARATWLSLSQVAREAGGRVATFGLVQAEDGAVSAQAEVVTGRGSRYRYQDQVWSPTNDGPPVEIAVSLFVTAVEERIRTGGNTPTERLAAARRVLDNLRAASDDPAGEPSLAAAVLHLARLLIHARRWDEALEAADEAIARYRGLQERCPGRYSAPLANAMTAKAAGLEHLGRQAEAAEIRRALSQL